jgi:tetratricopeptide (TPR) repeat protein
MVRAMWITSLLLATGAVQDPAAWIERLEFPTLTQADLNLVVGDKDLGIEGLGLEFPEDPKVRVEEALAKVREGDRSSLTLHQAASGLAAVGDRKNLEKVLPACLQAYMTELRTAPNNTDLRVHFAEALLLAGTVIRDDRFFRDAGVELAKVAQQRPEDWRVLDEHARVLITRSILSRAEGGADPAWLGRALVLASEAQLLAPKQTGPRWRRFHASYMGLLGSGRGAGDGLFVELAELADGLKHDAGEVEEPRLALVAEAYWFISNLAPIAAHFNGNELPAPASEEQVRARLAAFPELLASTSPSKLRSEAARAWWTLGAFLGEPERWRADLALAVEAGLPDEEGRVLALMGMHRRGEKERALALAQELSNSATTDHAWRTLAVFYSEMGDPETALASLTRVQGIDPILRLARALLELRTGATVAARDGLKGLITDVTGTHLAGPVAHAYGVALAVNGELEEARAHLSMASLLLDGEEAAAAKTTLAELK